MAFNLSMSASDIDKTLVESRQLLDSDPATKQYVDEAVANAGGSGGAKPYIATFVTTDFATATTTATFAEAKAAFDAGLLVGILDMSSMGNIMTMSEIVYELPGEGSIERLYFAGTMTVITDDASAIIAVFQVDLKTDNTVTFKMAQA